jgi:hypothetical protein
MGPVPPSFLPSFEQVAVHISDRLHRDRHMEMKDEDVFKSRYLKCVLCLSLF